MDQSNTQQPISDDQELAKVLAGVTGQDEAAEAPSEEVVTAPPVGPTPAIDPAASTPTTDPLSPNLTPSPAPVVDAPSASGDLDSVKKEALEELRPLVDKLNVSPEEKFDTYLLLLRSTDDRALIEPAHEAAKGIVDEARRAQALLDIIKEIDFLSQNQQSA